MVKSWLAGRSQRWLLIIDNADDLDIDYSQYMPSSRGGDVLLTTRNPESVAYETKGSESLPGLEPELARELLFKACSESRCREKEQAAGIVIETLGSHTLAIVQAGAYVRRKLCSLEEYPIIFQQQRGRLLKFHSKANLSTYGNVYATFEVSAEYLQRSRLPEDLDALYLLHTLAFMHSSGVSETIFQRASNYASKLMNEISNGDNDVKFLSKNHVTRVPGYLRQAWSKNVKYRWRNTCAILEKLSLITVSNDSDVRAICLHPLVHAWAKERQDHQKQCMAWQSASTTLALSCEGSWDFCPFFPCLEPQIRACVSHEIEKFTNDISDMEAGQTLVQFAYVLLHTSDTNSLGSLVQHLRLRLQDRDGVSQEMREKVETLTAHMFRVNGNYREAIQGYRHVLKSPAQRLAEDDNERVGSQRNLAAASLDYGQIDQAIELLEYVVRIRNEKLAEDNPHRLASQQLLEHMVKIQEKLAEDHPYRLGSQLELACAYQDNGQIDKVIELLEHVVKIVKEKLTENHPDLLNSEYALARAYKGNGQIDKAIELLEHVVKIDKENLTENHPYRLKSQRALPALMKQGPKLRRQLT